MFQLGAYLEKLYLSHEAAAAFAAVEVNITPPSFAVKFYQSEVPSVRAEPTARPDILR